jgi:hypothetical protein
MDGGGVALSGAGHVEVGLGGEYTADGSFTLAFWILKAPVEVWVPEHDPSDREVLYSHPIRGILAGRHRLDYAPIEVALTREAWLTSWTLSARVVGIGTIDFVVDLHQDSVPRWTHIAVVVEGNVVSAHVDGVALRAISTTAKARNLVIDLQRGDCTWDPCVADGSCVTTDDHGGVCMKGFTDIAASGECTGVNGIRRCGATSSSSVAYNGEPGLAIDGNRDSNYNTGLSCTHTDASMSWWQVDLGQQARVNNVDIWHATAPARYVGRSIGAFITLSDTADFRASGVRACGQLTDRKQVPENIRCLDGPVEGQYVTVFFDDANAVGLSDNSRQSSAGWNGGSNHDGSWLYICEIAVWGWLPTGHKGAFRGTVGLASTAVVGATKSGASGLKGSIAMLQIYASALSIDALQCLHESGQLLVQNGKMGQSVPSLCRGPVTTGCTSIAATTVTAQSLDTLDPDMLDDGSCRFDSEMSTSERGLIHITDAWQQVLLHGSYRHPVVFLGVLTRQSTAQAVVRLRNVAMDLGGTWSFDVRAEQKSCHFAKPPPTAERVSYLVVDAGVSEEGWQAGVIRARDREWHRVSLLHPFHPRVNGSVSTPVVISHVQNFDSRTEFVTTRHYLVPKPLVGGNTALYQAFFLQIQGEGVWCPDGHFYTEYFDNLELGGTPVAAVCEPTAPDWHWHACCEGVPSAMAARGSVLFSARWTSRLLMEKQKVRLSVSSTASSGSRIMLDGTTVLDKWEECCSTFTSDLIPISEGYHIVNFEYRSAANLDVSPTESYAVLTYFTEDDTPAFGITNHTDARSRAIGSDTHSLHADVGWLGCVPGSSTISGRLMQAGFAQTTSGLTTVVDFGDQFTAAPLVLAGLVSTGTLSGHIRLLTASKAQLSLATEYDTCNFVVGAAERTISWIVMPTSVNVVNSAVSQRPTNASDVAALLRIRESLSLPDYLQWHNGSDPCHNRWAGIECRTFGETPRVVVVDVRSFVQHG